MNAATSRDGRDIQRLVEAIIGGVASQSDVCHGDFEVTIGRGTGDVSGFVEALLTY